ncbi:hypothetical protein N7468_010741 [Penicillium chermesinum]|uniref:Uncharacterized protein n=1 Tax=Penicillium chermesinum TaxID=63820 RepID=A0A9W9N8B7_9EURO|nr:uncharacterized protein N7468_010741 [Penicillium chermesinum]KAJ5215062.1 hypothetical protein N7468_010741 [Penicillium chermesinum]
MPPKKQGRSRADRSRPKDIHRRTPIAETQEDWEPWEFRHQAEMTQTSHRKGRNAEERAKSRRTSKLNWRRRSDEDQQGHPKARPIPKGKPTQHKGPRNTMRRDRRYWTGTLDSNEPERMEASGSHGGRQSSYIHMGIEDASDEDSQLFGRGMEDVADSDDQQYQIRYDGK